MKLGIFICARLSSQRLPRKHLLKAGGIPMIGWLIRRCRHVFARELEVATAVVVVTATTDSADTDFLGAMDDGAKLFRGDVENIPLRYLQAADKYDVDAVISVEGDDVLCAAEGMQAVAAELKKGVSCIRTDGLPFGMNLCGFSTSFLRAGVARIGGVMPETGWISALGVEDAPSIHFAVPGDGSDIRLTLDYEEDYLLFKRIIEGVGSRIVDTSAAETLEYIRTNALAKINSFRMEDFHTHTRECMSADGFFAGVAWEGKGQDLYRKAKRLIPGGTQLLSKRPEMYLPGGWPAYYSRAKGAEVWDLDGRHYYDFTSMSVGACPLGYADPDVDAAVCEAVARGNMSSLNAPEEVELAELITELHPWAENVRYARGGGDGMAVAVRIARATTGRDRVAICGYHGWHDWYLAVNIGDNTSLDGHLLPGLEPAGIPRPLRETASTFHVGDLPVLESIIAAHGRELAAVVMEPVRNKVPPPGYLDEVKRLAHSCRALLIFDEVSSGFRLCCGGAHLVLGVEPDIAVLAKGISNGYPMATIFGTAIAMAGAQKAFISSTYWTDRIGPVAALACMRKYRRLKVHERQQEIGELLLAGWEKLGKKHGLSVSVGGIPALTHFNIAGEFGQAAQTLFTKLMLDKGYLAATGVYPTLTHTPEMVDAYLVAVDQTFEKIASIGLSARLFESLAPCDVAHTGFKRLN